MWKEWKLLSKKSQTHVLSLKKDNKLVDILFNDEEINSEAMLVVIGDSERKTQSFYNLILDDTNTSVCEDE